MCTVINIDILGAFVAEPDESAPACPFCAIARGKQGRVEIVCEGHDWVAFFPLEPATAGHTLVIPRVHSRDLWAVEPETMQAVFAASVHVGRAIERALVPHGLNLITSSGSAAEQTVF